MLKYLNEKLVDLKNKYKDSEELDQHYINQLKEAQK